MLLHYYKHRNGIKNFGDDLNPWLWEKLLPGVFDSKPDVLFLGVGTLLNQRTPKEVKKVVFSTGVGYGDAPEVDGLWKIYCLRGPLSAKALGVSLDLAVTDGAVLVKKVFPANGLKKFKFSFMPHLTQALVGGQLWREICETLKINYIDPQWETEEILSRISNSECLITEALHGAIVADAYRIPWVPIITHQRINTFKWQDWFASLEIDYSPNRVMPLWNWQEDASFIAKFRKQIKKKLVYQQLKRIKEKSMPILSPSKRLNSLIEVLENRCVQFQSDLKRGILWT